MLAIFMGQFLLSPPPTKLILIVYVCKYVHLSVHTCIHVSRCGHIYLVYVVCINLHVYVCACSYIYICGHAHVPLNMHACLSVCFYIHVHMWTHLCMCIAPSAARQDRPSLDDDFHADFNSLPRHPPDFFFPQAFTMFLSSIINSITRHSVKMYASQHGCNPTHLVLIIF